MPAVTTIRVSRSRSSPSGLVVTVYCQLADDGADLADEDDDGDTHWTSWSRLLAKIRTELLAGNTSFLTAVAEFYGGFDEDEDEDEETSSDDRDESSATSFDDMSKAELQQECETARDQRTARSRGRRPSS